MIGSAIGGAVDPETIQGPKIGDVAKQTSAEGVSRPIVFGRSPPIGGNVIADGGPEIVKRTESGKGGPEVETESAYRTYAIGICEGPGVVLLQAWRNGQLVFDIENAAMADDNALFLEYARWFDGSYDQMPSPDLESVYGAGNVSAQRGSAYIVFHKEDVTDNRGSWSQWQFRVGRFMDVQEGQYWALRFPDDNLPPDRVMRRSGEDQVYGPEESRPQPNANLGQVDNNNLTAVRSAQNTAVLYGTSRTIEVYTNPEDVLQAPTVVTIPAEYTVSGSQDLKVIHSFGRRLVAIFSRRLSFFVSEDGGYIWTEVDGPVPDLYIGDVVQIDEGSWISYVYDGPSQGFHYTVGDTFNGWMVGEFPSPGPQVNSASCLIVCGNWIVLPSSAGRVFRSFGGAVWSVSDFDVIPENAFRGASRGDTIVVTTVNEGVNLGVSYDAGQTWEMRSVPGAHATVLAGRTRWILSGGSSLPMKSADLMADDWSPVDIPLAGGAYVWKIGYVSPATSYLDGYYPLRSIIDEIAERVTALPYIDSSLLDDYQCRGFTITNSYPASSALSELSKAFFFSPSNVNGRLKFTPLGGDAIEVITEDQMIESEAEVDPDARRSDSVSVPRVLHLVYHDVMAGLNTDKQRSEKPEGPRAVGEQQWQTTIIFNADEAATVNAKYHAMLTEQQKGELNFALPDNYLSITESDPVIVKYEGKSVRCIIQMVNTDDGEQSYKALRDRQSIHTMQVQGIPPAVVTPPPSRRIGPTLLEIIDGGPLNDLHDAPGFYVAISGLYPAWQGALIELSLDGGATYIDSRVVRSGTIMGTLTSSFADHPQPYPDQHNSFTVSIGTPDATLEATDLAGMLNGRNLAVVGNEFLQFADAVEVSDGVWELGYLIRGRKGTDTEAHAISERFVMLNGALFVPSQYAWRGQTITLRATSLGTTTDEATIKTFTFDVKNQVERKVGNLRAHKSGSDLVVQWQKVGRLGAGANADTGLNYIGSVVQITDGSHTVTYRGNGPDGTETYSTPLAPFSGPITITAYQRNRYTNLGPPVEIFYANP